MKTIALKSAKIKNIFQQLEGNFGGEIQKDAKEYILEIDNQMGQGLIKGMTFNSGISYLEFDMTFSEDFQLVTETTEETPICFAYCAKGKVAHSFGLDKKKRVLENFQTGILTSKSLQDNVIYFEKNVDIKITLIVVNPIKSETDVKTLNYKLQNLFYKENISENYIYIGSYNLKIAEKIQQLAAVSQKGIVRSLMIESLVQMILALEIEQHSEDMKSANQKTGTLSAWELTSVKELSQFINNYPERNLTVTDLCRKGGLSPSKLQEGFKLMHGRTVIDYIREVRVRKAENLIKNTDLNISEVVYSIGFTSRSYFSKIFKSKYNCSPKQYKAKQMAMAI
ncbi:helix-turn-helix domain-containing protein [Maribacter hydrothermalis]|uniref:AraC family transcriptional regulator n=1 Tax=Maribacter hydrothermalis TaxID=1836467 RepID=A0A1B7Z1E6_9FLAO|nr:AraC family transcriptional regulator [Maribacter hydrothermalis]APQ18161.1 AraC family transcriptional regulator [Maribacter hydrothermalis]OBR36508.1 AraC family transcriptional regulator [Maribacter hydrothermalis]